VVGEVSVFPSCLYAYVYARAAVLGIVVVEAKEGKEIYGNRKTLTTLTTTDWGG
jgi:hypothetical protein